jgi:transcriptional regulator with XRE-family HTH domain
MGLADKLRKLCAIRGLDQSRLADLVGISKSSMSRILTGAQEPRLRLASGLAEALGVTLDYLVDDSLEADPAGHVVVVSEDEMTILKLVRRLGSNVAIDRLLKVTSPLLDSEAQPIPPSSNLRARTKGSGQRADS